MTDSAKTVTIFGTSKAQPDDPVFDLAEKTGRIIAEAGYNIANGGYGGTMLACSKGASEIGAKIVGVTCKAFKRSIPNEYITDEISTDCLNNRLAKLIELGDAYIVLPGGTGTLLELADVWEHKNKGFANADKPIILIRNFWSPLVEMMNQADPKSRNCIHHVENPEQIVEILDKSLQ